VANGAGKMSRRLEVLRIKISEINEQLGKFSPEEVPDSVQRDYLLREHHSPIFDMIPALSYDLITSTTPQKVDLTIAEILQFFKVRLSSRLDGLTGRRFS